MQGMTMATRVVPGLDEARQSRLVIELNRNLAALTDLAAAYQQAHWNVIGMDFAQLHVLFDQFADQTRESMDLTAGFMTGSYHLADGGLHRPVILVSGVRADDSISCGGVAKGPGM